MAAERRAELVAGLAFGLLLLSAVPARAQIDTASIVGTVKDEQGGVLPGVTVTATQDATGVVSTNVTNSSGQYVFPGVKVGRYTVAAELPGFKRAVRSDLDIKVQDRTEVDFTLSVGELSEVVTVSGRTEILQTQTADIGNVVDAKQINDLPLLGRRYSELAFLTPGVVVAPAGITSRGEDTFFNANGNFATWNNYTLDGADNNSFSTNLQERSPQVVQPPVDALQEFKVQTRTYSAEFGKAAGAVINASIKQGSNAFRGSVYGFARDEAFNSNTWDNNRAGRPKGKFNQYIAGATLGGPIVRGKTFFFGDYQATRTERALSATATVPTARMKQGDFSELTLHHERVEPVRARRLRRRGGQAGQRLVLRPGRGEARQRLSAAQRARRRLLQQQLHLQRRPQQRHRPVRRARRPHAVDEGHHLRALQLPGDQPQRAAGVRGSGAVG